MPYKVFISHSAEDQRVVVTLANFLAKFNIDVAVAEWYLSPGSHIEKQISTQIEKSDCVVVLLTRNGLRSNWVQQEIGYAISKRKIVIPLVEKGADHNALASLQGKEYIEFDPSNPEVALSKTSTFVKNLKLKKEEQESALLVAACIIGLLLLFLGSKK